MASFGTTMARFDRGHSPLGLVMGFHEAVIRQTSHTTLQGSWTLPLRHGAWSIGWRVSTAGLLDKHLQRNHRHVESPATKPQLVGTGQISCCLILKDTCTVDSKLVWSPSTALQPYASRSQTACCAASRMTCCALQQPQQQVAAPAVLL